MRYSVTSLLILTSIVCLFSAAISTLHEWWLGVFHLLVISMFLSSVMLAVYSQNGTRRFGLGCAICTGLPLLLTYMDIGIVGESFFPLQDSYSASFVKQDVCDSFVIVLLGYAGGILAASIKPIHQEQTAT